MTNAERQTLERLYELVGSTAGKVDTLLLSVADLDMRMRSVEISTASDRAVDQANDAGARDRSITRRWVIGVIVSAISVTAAIVLGIVNLVSKL